MMLSFQTATLEHLSTISELENVYGDVNNPCDNELSCFLYIDTRQAKMGIYFQVHMVSLRGVCAKVVIKCALQATNAHHV